MVSVSQRNGFLGDGPHGPKYILKEITNGLNMTDLIQNIEGDCVDITSSQLKSIEINVLATAVEDSFPRTIKTKDLTSTPEMNNT